MKEIIPEGYRDRVSFVTPFADILQLSDFLCNMTHVTGINTGVLHLAAAMGKKVYCIIGPGSLFTAPPENESKRFFAEDIPCRPCQQYGNMACPEDMYCLRGIDYSKIGEAVAKDINKF